MVPLILFFFFLHSRNSHVDRMIPPNKRNEAKVRHIIRGIEDSVAFKGFNTGRRSLNPLNAPNPYGADPTGREDSTDAFLKAFEVLLTHFQNHTLAQGLMNLLFFEFSGAKDLGGATIDLEGGQYLISKPLVVPVYYGNFMIERGTIRASSSFPGDRYLFEVGGGASVCNTQQASCGENVSFKDLFLDCAHVAGGGIYVGSIMGCRINSCYFTGFNHRGVFVDSGHETIIDNCWFGEFYWGDPRKGKEETGTAIYLGGHDMFVSDTIVFSALIGIHNTYTAQVYSSCHLWNGGEGHISFYFSTPQGSWTRMVGCTSDCVDLVAVTPYQLTIDNCFFQYTRLILRAHAKGAKIRDVIIKNSQFEAPLGDDMIILDETAGKFAANPSDTIITDNVLNEHGQYKATRYTRELHLKDTDEWKFDFSDVLLFDEIKRVEYSITVFDDGKFVRHHATPPIGNVVSVRTDEKVTATVVVRVDQSEYYAETSL